MLCQKHKKTEICLAKIGKMRYDSDNREKLDFSEMTEKLHLPTQRPRKDL